MAQHLVYGVISYPHLFEPHTSNPKYPKRYSIDIMLPPGDPQIAILQTDIDQSWANKSPSDPNKNVYCLSPYDDRKDNNSYDPRFAGWTVFTANAKDTSQPVVVDKGGIPVLNRSDVFAGGMAWVHASIFAIDNGVTAAINGVKVAGVVGPVGRLDGKPTVEQMFADTSVPADAPAPPAPMAAPAPPPPPTAPVHQMTDAAQGTYEQYVAQGWTANQMIDAGLLVPPGASPSF